MATYYIQEVLTGAIFELTATTEVQISSVGDLTEFPLEDGSDASDNFVSKGRDITFSGVITSINSSDGDLLPIAFFRLLDSIKKAKGLFNVYYHPEAPAINNCALVSLSATQDTTNGYISLGSHSLKVTFTAKEVRFASRGELAVKKVHVKLSDRVDTKTLGGGGVEDPDKNKTTLRKKSLNEDGDTLAAKWRSLWG